tara:strand:+ start:5784 stop:6710 length:927 start_codon:yes stop_codon:yes gene_type:complete
MKNILVYEFFLNNDVSADEYIINEACFMVNFLLNFYLKYPNLFRVFIPINNKYKYFKNKNVEYIEASKLFSFRFDEVVVIAPEENYCLYNLLKKFKVDFTNYLSEDFVKYSSNKLKLYNKLCSKYSFIEPVYENPLNVPAEKIITKPIDGYGSCNTSVGDVNQICKLNKNYSKKFIFQKFHDKPICSANILVNSKKSYVLSINEIVAKQKNNNIITEKIIIGKHNNLLSKVNKITESIIKEFNIKKGVFGFDFILVNSHTIKIIDVNPRLTTSFFGLIESLPVNPLEYLYNLQNKFNINDHKVCEINL